MAVFVFARPALLQRSHSDMGRAEIARRAAPKNKSKKIKRARKGEKVSGGAAAVVGGVAGEKAKRLAQIVYGLRLHDGLVRRWAC